MADRLTAEKARDLARAKDPSFAVDQILAGIEQAAREGKYQYITREFGFGSGECYGNEPAWPALCQAIVKELRALGFTARVRVQDGSQFCDLWLDVTWENSNG
ncbi:hypothetical protein [Kerstersia gyiorum]|uniref:Uncharacterized protein n=1 Tax=Kerstersia gyiorum TaxID=206506 RepID=A0A171KSD3_9BURK|nr:hypothetical protein [Kerstersia gyiorum]KKO71800.1 hypothetical protein AAV32_09485 [Kerstersia gyiorum]